MAGRMNIVVSAMVLLFFCCMSSSSAAPADVTGFFTDVTGISTEETTPSHWVTEPATEFDTETSIVVTACPHCQPLESVDAATLEPVEPTTELDLESVVIDLGVDRVASSHAAAELKIDNPATEGETSTATDAAPNDPVSTEIPADATAALPSDDLSAVQEKMEDVAVAEAGRQTTLIEEAAPTESATTQPEADAGRKKIHSNNQTDEVTPSAIVADAEDLLLLLLLGESTTSVQEEMETMGHSDDAETTTASMEAAPSSETVTSQAEADSEISTVLQGDFKEATEDRNEGTDIVNQDATLEPEFDVTAPTESVPMAFKSDAEGTPATPATSLENRATESVSSALDQLTDGDDVATRSANEVATESAFQSAASAAETIDTSGRVEDDIVAMEPQLVKIFDPSVDVEATTFLAEANLQTDAEGEPPTTESFYQADGFGQSMEDETLATTDDTLQGLTIEIGTESGTESATESEAALTSDTGTALPVETELARRPSGAANTKRRSYKGYKVYRVLLPTEDAVRRILSMEDEPGVEFWADPRLLLRPRGLFVTSAADVMVAPPIVPQIEAVFRQERLTYTVLVDDVDMSIAKENPTGPSFARSQTGSNGQHRLTWDKYHRLSDINSYLEYLKETHPEWIQVVPIGKSSQGRPIHVVKLSRNSPSRGMEASQKKAILVDAGMHANEWITPAALTWMINELVENVDSYSCIFDRFDWYFVPMVNPDGYEYSHVVDRMWRKTRRNYTSPLVRSSARKLRVDAEDEQCLGADINRNFEFHWRKGGSSSNVCSPAFAGVKPFSEPESRALANFMLKQRSRLAMYISLHSYSQMWLLPWGFAEARPQDFSELYSLAKIGARALQRTHNTSYLIGSVPDLLALASGTSQDWAKGVAGVRYAYTLEMRDAGVRGMILPAQQIVPTAEETWAGIYAASVELAHRLYQHLPSCSPF